MITNETEGTDAIARILLRKSADLLDKSVWIQGEFHREITDENGKALQCYCLMGAVRHVCEGRTHSPEIWIAYQAALERLADVMVEVTGFTGENSPRNVIMYNDDPTRTKEECVAVLRKAAA